MSTKRKRCRYCRCLFMPDSRVSKQIACGKESCRKARKKESQKRWHAKNPEYFKERYENTRSWLNDHPGYLRFYRESHPEYVERNRANQKNRGQSRNRVSQQIEISADSVKKCDKTSVDIQDTILLQPFGNTGDIRSLLVIDIQDTILTQQFGIKRVMSILPCVDIQDVIKNPIMLPKIILARSRELRLPK